MTTMELDNGIGEDIKRTITWQFDNAENLIAVITMFKDFFDQSTRELWDDWHDDVADIDTADDFGLSIWGKMLGCERKNITIGSTTRSVSTNVYRNILKARFRLLNSKATVSDYLVFVKSIFGNGVKVTDGNDMSLTFTKNSSLVDPELVAIIQQVPEMVFVYPAGVKDNNDPDGYMFSLADTGSTRTKAQVIADYPNIGGLDESTFTWL